MTVKEYNEWYNKLNHAKSFVYCIDHALQKSDENARMQFRVIGWSEELKEFLDKAIECYAKEMRSRVEIPTHTPKKKRKYYRKCPVCGMRFEQTEMVRSDEYDGGWVCNDCFVDTQNARHAEYFIDEW